MSEETPEETRPGTVGDEQLPEDLRPTDDNPLAQPLDPEEARSPEELDMQGGKTPEQSDDSADGASEDESEGQSES